MMKMANLGFGRARMEFKVPSRGLIGFRSAFLTETRGTGLLNSLFGGWQPYGGPMLRRSNGAIVSDRLGVTTPYALFHIQPRGTLLTGDTTAASFQRPSKILALQLLEFRDGVNKVRGCGRI